MKIEEGKKQMTNVTYPKYQSENINVGDIAGYDPGDGNLYVDLKGETYRLDHIVWFHVHGVYPPEIGKDVIHINGNRHDNSLSNLKLVDMA
jgi:hypothetical protein